MRRRLGLELQVLVTGASGYIGTHVVQQLQEQGYRVRGTVRSMQNPSEVEPLRQVCPQAKYPVELVEADLLTADSWPPAVEDALYVIHMASPVPLYNPRREDEVIKPAVEGTLNVLRACHATGGVKRVVLTSSCMAVSAGVPGEHAVYTEADWTDPEKVKMTYMKSKTLAERAAWDYHSQLTEPDRFELAVINPALVMGPPLCGVVGTSMEMIRRLMHHETSMVPRVNFPLVDVRDVAAAHVAAMTVPEAAGHRHIVCAENLWYADIAGILASEFQPQGYKVPTAVCPDALLWLHARFNRSSKMILPSVGKVAKLDNGRMENVLGIKPRDVKEALLDMCYSLIEQGFVKKTSKYTPRKDQSAAL